MLLRQSCFRMGALALFLLLICACADSANHEKTFEEMSDDDALVEVGDRRLTKKEVTQKLQMVYDRALRQRGGNPSGAMRMVQREQAKIIDRFIDRRLFSDLAAAQKLVSPEVLNQSVESNLTKIANARKTTAEDLRKEKPDEYRYMREAFEEEVLINAYVASNIMPKVKVPDEMVSNYLAVVRAENQSVGMTNALVRAKLLGIAEICRKDSSLWEKLTHDVGEEVEGITEFSYDEFGDKCTADAVFGAKEGEVVGPFDEDDGYRLIKVVSITGEDGSPTGGVRACRQVFCSKEPEFFTWDFETTRRELRSQLSQRMIGEQLEAMRTNGTAVIRYPNGRNVWQRKKSAKTAEK